MNKSLFNQLRESTRQAGEIVRGERAPSREFSVTPNPETAETLRKSERGEDVHTAKDAEAMFRDLGL